ncbi:MAG: glycine--tRNA ligase subunit beta [Adlercreutzia equolifaciens]
MSDTATLAFEIGTEEIPAFDLKRATEQLAELVPAALDAVRIPHGEVAIYTSPRRLIAIVADVAARTEALEEVFRGPAAKIAFDEAGNPTKAAIGFARGKGSTWTRSSVATRTAPVRLRRAPGSLPGCGGPAAGCCAASSTASLAEVLPLGHRPRCSRARCAGWWRFWVTR